MNSSVVGVLVTICILLAPGLSRAKSRTITIMGPVSCTEWISGREERKSLEPGKLKITAIRTEAWLTGLLTGLNSGLPGADLLASVNAQLAFDWMDRFCARNPNSDLYDGATELLKDVAMQRRK